MVLITTNKRVWLLSAIASLVILAVVYFAVIRPANNTADRAVRTGAQQAQQALNQAQKQLKQDGVSTGAAQKAVGTAAKLASCVAAAGTDAAKLSACQTKYGE